MRKRWTVNANRKVKHLPNITKLDRVAFSPFRTDPSRTSALRRKVGAELRRRYMRLRKAILTMIKDRDALGLKQNQYTHNTAWKYETSAGKVKRFRAWLRQQMDSTLAGDVLIEQWIQEAHGRGAKRAFDELRKGSDTGLVYADLPSSMGGSQSHDMMRAEALRRIKTHKPTVEKVKLLAGRTFSELEGINAQMATKMSRLLAEGLARGWTPTKIANQMSRQVSITINQALTITHNELIRAHAEGTLDGLQDQGETKVTARVEFVTANDDRVCVKCRSLEGRVYSIEDARGIIPVHPLCRCTWLSVKTTRKRMTRNAFCHTGDGGGIDPTCPPHESRGGSADSNVHPDKGRSEAKVDADSKGTSGTATDIKPQSSATDSGGAQSDKGTTSAVPQSSQTNPAKESRETTPNPATGLPRTFGTGGNQVTPQGVMGTPFFSGVSKTIDGIYKGSSGPKPSLNDLGDMAGAQPGSKVTARVVEDGKTQDVVPGSDKREIQILVDHADLGQTMKRRIGRDAEGNVFVHNEFIKVFKKGGGTGTDIFGRGVENAKRLGAKYIACHAARFDAYGQDTMTGYRAWPAMGYDESLKSIEGYNANGASAIKQQFPNAQSIQDVVATKEGSEWWAKNGFDLHHMKFDLADGSRSMKKFANYLSNSKG